MLVLGFLLISVVPPEVEGRIFIKDSRGQKIDLEVRKLPPRWDQCHPCHPHKQKEFMSTKSTTLIEHKNIQIEHGRFEILCQHCHNVNDSNYLRAHASGPSSFQNSSNVCERCHADRYRDWVEGIHGRRVGSWNQQKAQLHCIDCHSPHDVAFKPMKASPPPVAPKFLIEEKKESEH